ncbi:mRNA splicing protein [Elasticomyces elasticus]|nr:mRNA splicing protein [Elasticomyces elasticus]KAK3666330.1 mRNA splicing protein [Elasticomyces elasticus]KAK4917709.1 mRNA splicing protein [Elasticomyces elasticus]KAK5766270.1 mRNA splicing protein [Elasticomyces elasticus]
MSNKNTAVAKTGKPAESANKSNDRNEYIPSFISKKPFYISDELQTDADYLDHQRSKSEKTSDTLAEAKWYDRGTTTGQRATKYRKGACENCGSMSHKAKDCLQRKRKQGAKWTGRDIAGDERVQEVKLGWDAKRDRWNGFTAEEYKEVVEDYEVMEEMKKAKIAAAKAEAGEDDEEADGEEGAKYEAETDMGRKQATSTRQLRLREDTAKYLLNLDLESAKYDPKTRSMLDTETSTNELIAEDGFQRASGDAAEFEKATRYAWETQEKGSGGMVHLQANPTEAQLTRKRKAEDEIQKAETKRKQLAEKYGAQDDIVKKPSALIAASNDRYVEYDAHGRPKGALEAAKKVEKSMYAEDVLINNHTSVWGSWWKSFQWGYACCHSTVKNSFCTGEEGREAAEHAEAFSKGLLLPGAEEQSEEVVEDEAEKVSHVPNAPDRPEKQNMDESRRRAEELTTGVTEEDMEKYRREKVVGNDPMAGLLGKDELVG